MIDLVDSLVRGVIEGGVINGSGAEVSFDPPTKDWSARRSTPFAPGGAATGATGVVGPWSWAA